MAYIFLAIVVSIVLYTAFSGKNEYRAFTVDKTLDRIGLYKRWIIQSWILFAAVGLLVLVALGVNDLLAPIARTSLLTQTETTGSADHFRSIVLGVIIGVCVGIGIIIFRAKRAVKKMRTVELDPILPRTSRERRYAVGMALTAGISEELFFRAAIPAVVFAITSNVTVAVVVSIVLFGIEHLYQGVKGVLGTAVLGWVFMKLFMLSGNLLVPMIVHMVIDLYGLLLYPKIVQWQQAKHRK